MQHRIAAATGIVIALRAAEAGAQDATPPEALPEGQVAVPVAVAPPPTVPPLPKPVPPVPPATPEPCPPPPEESWIDHRGARLTGGFAFMQDGTRGGFGRLELEDYSLKQPDQSWVGGVLIGLEGWGSKEGGGGGIPTVFYTGFREDTSVFASLGAGFDWAIYDRVHEHGGFGIFAPIAALSFGVDLEGVRILADGRATYRWQWKAGDFYQLTAGLTFSVTSDH